MITLRSDRLQVEIALPGECPADTQRFDRAGAVSQVILDGHLYFCTQEPFHLQDPCTGGAGLCCEYKFDSSAEAGVGEQFPKFGVGLIRRESEEPYIFWKHYRDIEYFPVREQHDESAAVFITEPIPCMGYAVSTTKRIRVEDCTLEMSVEFRNEGEKPVTVREYCHNFLSPGGMAIGPEYRYTSPLMPDLGHGPLLNQDGTPCVLESTGKGVTFSGHQQKPCALRIKEDRLQDVPFEWRMEQLSAGAYVEERDSFPAVGMDIWACDHMMCPEIIQCFTVRPGEKYAWTRTWQFGKLGEDSIHFFEHRGQQSKE